MPELSNSVRHRLGARPAPTTHPDADTLTAYVEQLLPAVERDQIVEHRAACSFCREVVSLSLPAIPEKTVVHTLPAPSRFWKFGFRWAGAVAVIAIAVALVVYRPSGKDLRHSPVAETPATPATEASTPKTADSATTEKSAVVASSEPFRTRTAAQSTDGRVSGAAGTASRGTTGTVQPPPTMDRESTARNQAGKNEFEARNAEVKDALNSNSGVPPVAVLESNNQAKPALPQNKGYVNSNFFSAEERSGAYNYSNSYQHAREEQARADADREKKRSTLALANPPNGEQDATPHKGFLRKAVPIGPIATTVMGTLKSATAGPPVAPDALAGEKGTASGFAAAPVRPAISSGAVSSMAAKVSHEPLDTRRAKAASSDQLHWRVQDGKLVNSADLSQWHEAYPPQSDEIQFKVVQAQGHEVWAGGSNATLVHSWNGGVDWQKLNLGDAASGDVEKISVSGGDVQVKTSNGQHLISRDGGKTWTPLNVEGNPTQPK